MTIITENTTKIKVQKVKKDVHRKMPVFYNPIMKSNRNLSILLLNSISNKQMKIALPLAGSGIRGLRFLKELKPTKIKQLSVNDIKPDFKKTFQANLKLNQLKSNKTQIYNQEASLFLLQQEGFDYIDLDPFGSPNLFLAAAISRISRNGILAVTATDTAALTGTYLQTTKRKYWATSLKNYLMHETGLRILIRKVQLQGVQFDKALTPILSYHKDHYFRIYFVSQRSKQKCDKIIKEHQYFLYCNNCLNFKTSYYNQEKCTCGKSFLFAGPLWTGKLFDQKLVTKMAKNNHFSEEQKFLDLLKEESKIDMVGFYDLHVLAKKAKKKVPKFNLVLKKYNAVRTHFSLSGIKTKKKIKFSQ